MDEDLTGSRQRIMDLLDERMYHPGHLRGISTGFDGIDYVTGGFQPEQYVVLIGTIKSFKSATLLAMAVHVHRAARVPLFIGFEMSNVEQTDRTLSLLSGVSLTRIMNGTLTQNERDAVNNAVRDLQDMRPFIFSSDIASATTVSGVQAKIQEYNPDVVFIDGAYMMQSELERADPGSPQALTDISRSLKRLAQNSKTPITITTQASLMRSKGGLHAGSAMYTQAWGQDCDVLLGVERQGERKANESASEPVDVKFRVLESRSGPRAETLLRWNWNEGSVKEVDETALVQNLTGPKSENWNDDDD
jgi:replicative DNA helicase